ncbi:MULTISPECIES: hypothetical protein [unclassified Fredinandcohnia]|uniref:hypothetical protein n=1 Tax=unclassified Fredinandcohnia TaxID=2837514 RepID=UPI0030FDF3F7
MKWKNYGLWVSLASILYMVFKDLGAQIDLTAWETYVTAILGLLGALGIISNPDKGKGFFDKITDSPVDAITHVTEQLQSQDQSPTGQEVNTPQQQPQNQIEPVQSQNQINQLQNEYPNYQNQTINAQQNYNEYQNSANVNNATYSQEVEQSQVQSEVNIDTNQYASNKEHTPSDFDRNSIHGMPAPPNEHM